MAVRQVAHEARSDACEALTVYACGEVAGLAGLECTAGILPAPRARCATALPCPAGIRFPRTFNSSASGSVIRGGLSV